MRVDARLSPAPSPSRSLRPSPLPLYRTLPSSATEGQPLSPSLPTAERGPSAAREHLPSLPAPTAMLSPMLTDARLFAARSPSRSRRPSPLPLHRTLPSSATEGQPLSPSLPTAERGPSAARDLFLNDTAPTDIFSLSLPDALPIPAPSPSRSRRPSPLP